MKYALGCEEWVDGGAVLVEAELEWAWREDGESACAGPCGGFSTLFAISDHGIGNSPVRTMFSVLQDLTYQVKVLVLFVSLWCAVLFNRQVGKRSRCRCFGQCRSHFDSELDVSRRQESATSS